VLLVLPHWLSHTSAELSLWVRAWSHSGTHGLCRRQLRVVRDVRWGRRVLLVLPHRVGHTSTELSLWVRAWSHSGTHRLCRRQLRVVRDVRWGRRVLLVLPHRVGHTSTELSLWVRDWSHSGTHGLTQDLRLDPGADTIHVRCSPKWGVHRQPPGYQLVVDSVEEEMQLTSRCHEETHRLPQSELREGGDVGEVVTLLVVVEALCAVVPLILPHPATTKVVGDSLTARRCALQTKCQSFPAACSGRA
jgi:hypothetical protein